MEARDTQAAVHPRPAGDERRPATGVLARMRQFIGPGVVTGASDDDPSGIGTFSQAGAQFGTGMLWLPLFTFPLMACVQIISARIARVTGRGLAAN